MYLSFPYVIWREKHNIHIIHKMTHKLHNIGGKQQYSTFPHMYIFETQAQAQDNISSTCNRAKYTSVE